MPSMINGNSVRCLTAVVIVPLLTICLVTISDINYMGPYDPIASFFKFLIYPAGYLLTLLVLLPIFDRALYSRSKKSNFIKKVYFVSFLLLFINAICNFITLIPYQSHEFYSNVFDRIIPAFNTKGLNYKNAPVEIQVFSFIPAAWCFYRFYSNDDKISLKNYFGRFLITVVIVIVSIPVLMLGLHFLVFSIPAYVILLIGIIWLKKYLNQFFFKVLLIWICFLLALLAISYVIVNILPYDVAAMITLEPYLFKRKIYHSVWLVYHQHVIMPIFYN